MENYLHKVKYYETDKMGVTHHSNYIRWMEEARVDFLDKIGFSYRKLEEMGAISPVIGVECEYKISTQFDDIVEIKAFDMFPNTHHVETVMILEKKDV